MHAPVPASRCACIATKAVDAGAWSAARSLCFITKHGVAAALGLGGQAQAAEAPCVLLDVRRHDERALYGSIRGSLHVPGAGWPVGAKRAIS